MLSGVASSLGSRSPCAVCRSAPPVEQRARDPEFGNGKGGFVTRVACISIPDVCIRMSGDWLRRGGLVSWKEKACSVYSCVSSRRKSLTAFSVSLHIAVPAVS